MRTTNRKITDTIEDGVNFGRLLAYKVSIVALLKVSFSSNHTAGHTDLEVAIPTMTIPVSLTAQEIP
jgi:hypothetical protein